MEENIIDEHQEPEKKKSSFKNIIKWSSLVILVTVFISLISIKYTSDTFTWGKVFLYGGLSLVVFGGTFIYLQFPNLFKRASRTVNEEKLPAPITAAQSSILVDRLIMGSRYANVVEFVIDSGVEEHGRGNKQKIYFEHVKCKYRDNGKKVEYFVAINMHYPLTNYRIIPFPKNTNQMHRAKALLATDPEPEPERETTVSEDILSGRKIIHTVTSPTKRKVKKKPQGELG